MIRWRTTKLTSEGEIFDLLAKLRAECRHCRGQPEHYALLPSIDRDHLETLSRIEKLTCERQSIDIYRATARFFSHPGEHEALTDDFVALAVLRHHGVPTRLLDWSRSPYVAAYWAAGEPCTKDGELWCFDEFEYTEKGTSQWKSSRWAKSDARRGMLHVRHTAFLPSSSDDWIICMSYPQGFGRQNAQDGLYTMAAQFGRDHAELIAKLLEDPSLYHRYVIPRSLKRGFRNRLRDKHGIWRGSLFPDSAGAAETAKKVFP